MWEWVKCTSTTGVAATLQIVDNSLLSGNMDFLISHFYMSGGHVSNAHPATQNNVPTQLCDAGPIMVKQMYYWERVLSSFDGMTA
jgi:hypothetical protein